MTKQTTKQPQPTETGVSGQSPAISPAKADASAPKGSKARNIFEMLEAGQSDAGSRKAQLLGSVRQHLAELADYDGEAIDTDAKRAEVADTTAVELYQARTDGLMTADELSAILGEYFGFKTKKDGSPSKTPEGYGNVIRQRIVRSVAMAEYLDGRNDGGAFFSSLPPTAREQVEGVRVNLDNGHIGIWHAYKQLGDIRSANVSRPKLAHDASRISTLADELANVAATVEAWQDNRALLEAYAKLYKTLRINSEAYAAEME